MAYRNHARNCAGGVAGLDLPRACRHDERMTMDADGAAEFDYLDRDGAIFRRRKGQPGMSVNDVLIDGNWQPYRGDAFAAGMWGDVIPKPEFAG